MLTTVEGDSSQGIDFVAKIFYGRKTYWYDGFKTTGLDTVPGDLEKWFPCHAVFCQE